MLALALVWALVLALPSAAADAPPIELLRPGQFHGHEVTAQDGELWWALVSRGDSFVLEQREIRVQAAHDVLLDEEGERSGKRVEARGTGQALLLLRGVPGLRAGPVEAQRPEPKQLFPGQTCSLTVADGGWLLASGSAAVGPRPNSEFLVRDYGLWLENPSSRQRLAAFAAVDTAPPELIWAGDLERDGKLDLIIELGNHYNVTEWVLFLSSAAGPGERVGRVASFRSAGC